MPSKKKAQDLSIDVEQLRQIEADLKHILKVFEYVGLSDFLRYLTSPGKIILYNFWVGVIRGFGIIVGMTLVVTVLLWLLSYAVDFPFIGRYFLELKEILEQIPSVK